MRSSPPRSRPLRAAVLADRPWPCRPRLPRGRSCSVTDGPLIVQSDKTLLLEVDHPAAAEAPGSAIAPFAELERAPEHVHTYRVTPLALWNARAAGHDAEQVVDALVRFSRYAVPQPLLVDVVDTMGRYGRLQLDAVAGARAGAGRPRPRGAGGGAAAEEDRPAARRPASTTTRWSCTRPSAGHLKQALLKIGWPAEDLAGYVDGEAHPIALRRGRLDAARLPAPGRRRASGPAAPGSWCCRAARARRWSARRRWRRPRRPP